MKNYQKNIAIYLTMPSLIVTIVLLAIPVAYGVYLSFTNLDIIKRTNDFIGLKNYIKAFTDAALYMSIFRNIIYVVVVVTFNFLIGFFMAFICYQNFIGNKALRFIIILPMLLIPTAAAVLWRFLYNYDIGLINSLLTTMNLSRIGWLISPKFALLSVILTDIWAWTPWMFLILLAGMENLDKQVLEAANIDGASQFQVIKNIMLPIMSPIIAIAISLKAIETFRTFDYLWVMTGGGPGSSSDITSTFIFKQAFKHLQYGYASALSIIVMAVLVILTIFIVKNLITKEGNL
jgi:multiple sugar transport system permease protein